MKKGMVFFILLLQACGTNNKTVEINTELSAWNYENQKKWAELALDCVEGKEQSPINIDTTMAIPLSKGLEIKYSDISIGSLTNVGYAINAMATPNQQLVYNEEEYELLQFHYHVDAEHTIDDKLHPFEIHFVHKAKDSDRLAVIGVLFKEGQENPTIRTLLNHTPTEYKASYNEKLILIANELFPATKTFFSYNGSLTTPKCAEVVNWVVMSEPMELSKEQLEAIRKLFKGKTNRDLQELNDRIINVS